ncbi:HAD family hydrolase [Bradyrhizobium sp. BR 1432]|uniref:HAD family hydrolase n=1 Tax=Bradyrhizobium sp. BR 1432 TaxID=3447966 RepID=UPI003EE80099
MKPVFVFDWNGTLLDDANALLQTTNIILERFGRPTIDLDTFRDHSDVPLSILFRNVGMSEAEVAAVDHDGGAIFHDTYEPLADKAELRIGARTMLELVRQEAASSIIEQPYSRAPRCSIEKARNRSLLQRRPGL